MNSDTIKIDFIKMTGAGNDFVLIDNRDTGLQLDWSKIAPDLCDRHYGVGADGLLIVGNHPDADFVMQYYNADGSSGGMCGNGGRCAAAYVMGLSKLPRVSFYALDYLYRADAITGNNIQLRMKDSGEISANIPIKFDDEIIEVHFVDTGTQHTVIYPNDLSKKLQEHIQSYGIHEIAKCVRYSSHFAPAGTNVNFIWFLGEQKLEMRTYEKGVEDETLACGTGAIASAIVTSFLKNMPSPIEVRTRSHEELLVSFERVGARFQHVTLQGPTKMVFKGQYVLNNINGH